MNPAVTLGVTIAGGLKLILLFPYWAAQFCGAIVGAGFARVRTLTTKDDDIW